MVQPFAVGHLATRDGNVATRSASASLEAVSVPRSTTLRMRRVRRSGTEPELKVRRVLTRLGMRYRLSNRDLLGSPDVANRSRGWAVFVHGCFWHGHPGCRRASVPKTNCTFW